MRLMLNKRVLMVRFFSREWERTFGTSEKKHLNFSKTLEIKMREGILHNFMKFKNLPQSIAFYHTSSD